MTGAINSYTGTYAFALVNFDFPRWHTYEWANWQKLDSVLAVVGGGVVFKGTWANSIAYLVGDRVYDAADGKIYFCLVAHTSASSGTFADARTANPTYWKLAFEVPKYRGLWATATSYATNDIVQQGTEFYFCVTSHTSSASFATDTANWVLLFSYAAIVGGAVAQCRFEYVSTTQCRLTPYNGNKITINGTGETIPSAGVTLSNSGLSANTLYYVYAYMSGSTLTLEASTTAYEISTTTGMPIKTGDSTRTLVGVLRADASSQFYGSYSAGWGVASYWNRLPRFTERELLTPQTMTSTSYVPTLEILDQVAWPNDIAVLYIDATIRLVSGTSVGTVGPAGHPYGPPGSINKTDKSVAVFSTTPTRGFSTTNWIIGAGHLVGVRMICEHTGSNVIVESYVTTSSYTRSSKVGIKTLG